MVEASGDMHHDPPAARGDVPAPEVDVSQPDGDRPRSHWTFLTNHAHVLIAIARDAGTTTRAIANDVGITERAVRMIVRDLEVGGYISSQRVGRRKRYAIDPTRPFRHPMAARHAVGELIAVLAA